MSRIALTAAFFALLLEPSRAQGTCSGVASGLANTGACCLLTGGAYNSPPTVNLNSPVSNTTGTSCSGNFGFLCYNSSFTW